MLRLYPIFKKWQGLFNHLMSLKGNIDEMQLLELEKTLIVNATTDLLLSTERLY